MTASLILAACISGLAAIGLIFLYIKERKRKKDKDSGGFTLNKLPYSGIKFLTVDSPIDKKKSLPPIQIVIENNGVKQENVVLFNKNKYYLTDNFGNSEDVNIELSNKEQDYGQLISQISEKHLKTQLIRIQSANTSQVTQLIRFKATDVGGASLEYPLITQSYFSANQFQSGIIDVPVSVVIDGNFELAVNVLANTTVVLTFFYDECDMSSMDGLLEFSGLLKKNDNGFIISSDSTFCTTTFKQSKWKTFVSKIKSFLNKKGIFKIAA